jgi:hypothetical protein
MTDLHRYEDWLDSLDTQLRVTGHVVESKLGAAVSVPLAALRSADDVVHWAKVLNESFEARNEPLPREYLLKRFARLVRENSDLEFDPNEIAWEVLVGYRRK